MVARRAQHDAQRERERDDAHEYLKWIETLLEQLRRLENARRPVRAGVPRRSDGDACCTRDRRPPTTVTGNGLLGTAVHRGRGEWRAWLAAVSDDCRRCAR